MYKFKMGECIMKKGILPVVVITTIVGIFMLLYGIGIMAGLIESNVPIIFIIIGLAVFIAFIYALIYTALDRIKEIKEEDKDDLSKY